MMKWLKIPFSIDKKILLQNIPYVIFFWLGDKISLSIRHGSNILLSAIQGISNLFKPPFFSFNIIDILVGVICAIVVKWIIILKGKNAKKYREGVEYGSARWGNASDVAPYIDKNFYNNIILTQTEWLTMNSRMANPELNTNKNVLVIGGSGSGKTRYFVKPNIMQLHSSYVITDPKGTLLVECGNLLAKAGYRVKSINTINFKKSLHYNPFEYIRDEKDILKLTNTLIENTKGITTEFICEDNIFKASGTNVISLGFKEIENTIRTEKDEKENFLLIFMKDKHFILYLSVCPNISQNLQNHIQKHLCSWKWRKQEIKIHPMKLNAKV